MFKKLQQHWEVNGWRLFFILCTFAVTGTVTAWISKSITEWIDTDKFSLSWWLLKIAVLFMGYQIFILIFGFCFGQFAFFWKYEKKILFRMGLLKRKTEISRLAIFASGGGSNAKKIIEYFASSKEVTVSLVVCNKARAGVLEIAAEYGIKTLIINKQDYDGDRVLKELKEKKINFIVLAGYLWKLPPILVKAYKGKIINIHPALLPDYGGKGMYGHHVHEAVLANKEKESGITIHYVDEIYDNGEVIFQHSCKVEPDDTAETLAVKIQKLEHEFYPQIISSVLKKVKA